MMTGAEAWGAMSCCPDTHSLEEGCLARRFSCERGVTREVVSVDGDEVTAVTIDPRSHARSKPWKTSRTGWQVFWASQKGRPV